MDVFEHIDCIQQLDCHGVGVEGDVPWCLECTEVHHRDILTEMDFHQVRTPSVRYKGGPARDAFSDLTIRD